MSEFYTIMYLVASVLFILALQGLSSPQRARNRNFLAILATFIAIMATFHHELVSGKTLILIAIFIGGAIGSYIALKIKMTHMPQLVAGFHSLVGLAAVLIVFSTLLSPHAHTNFKDGAIAPAMLFEMGLGVIIGAITFSGSLIAFAKLQNLLNAKNFVFRGQKILNIILALSIMMVFSDFCTNSSLGNFFLLFALSLILGVMLIMPVGGADTPVVVSMLNSYSGFAAAGIGFSLCNSLLIIAGALVGASGAILSYVMCKAMNRSIFNVLFASTSKSSLVIPQDNGNTKEVKTGDAQEAAKKLMKASSVIIVPGYGMAGAQHYIKEMSDILTKHNVVVKFAMHPVAGRMPGHMNVLLAEANIDYDKIFELEDINKDFATCDVAMVIGANDITNPAAKTDKNSPIYGMPILEVEQAKTVFFIKRTIGAGYAGVENELFFKDNTIMLFGDAKKVVEEIVKSLPQS